MQYSMRGEEEDTITCSKRECTEFFVFFFKFYYNDCKGLKIISRDKFFAYYVEPHFFLIVNKD